MDGLPEQAVTGSLRLLIIEDSEQDLELAVRRLRASGLVFDYRCVTNERDMHDALSAEMPNLILADFTLPSFDGLSALEIAREHAPDVPFIFLSGTMGEERAVEALKSGATDYIVKSNPARLVAVVKRALAEADTRRRGRAAERQVTRLTRVLHMHSGINAALVRIRDRKELMVETCRLAHQVGGYAVAMVALIEPVTRTARPVSWAGFEFLRQPNIDFPVADSEAGDTSLMGRVIRSGEAALCEDIEHPDFPIFRRTALAEGGVRSLACLPLIVDGTPIGSFLCGTMATGVISHDELKLLEEVASNLSFALQYLEKQEAVQFLSYFEPLTGLAKRALFCERLERLLSRGSGRLPKLAITVFDIEHLRVVNDSHGRHTGDRLLQCVADRLKAQFPDTEQLAHLGGAPSSASPHCRCGTTRRWRCGIATSPPRSTDPSRSMAGKSRSRSDVAWPSFQMMAKSPTSWCRTPRLHSRKPSWQVSNTCITANNPVRSSRSASACSSACAAASRVISSCCTISPKSRSPPARLPEPRRCCAGGTATMAWSHRGYSCPCSNPPA